MQSIPGDTESHRVDGRDAFRERLAGWCIMAFGVLAEAYDSKFHRTMRDTTERHRHDLKAVMAIAAMMNPIRRFVFFGRGSAFVLPVSSVMVLTYSCARH